MVKIQFAADLKPAKNLEEVWVIFDPTLTLDPRTEYYVKRTDPELQKLFFDLKNSNNHVHAFLCGHRGSGKTTELNRLCLDQEINDKYNTVYLTAHRFGSETVHLTHDVVLLEMGLTLAEHGKDYGMPSSHEKELFATHIGFFHPQGKKLLRRDS